MAESDRQGGKLNVFISYSRDDLVFADQLRAFLLRDFVITIDRESITAGDDWKKRLGSLIRDADTIVFVLSPSSAQSDICAWEVAEAVGLGKRIIPVLCRSLDDVKPSQQLADLNFIFFYAEPKFPGSGFGTGLSRLIDALNTDPVWVREHTRYLRLAKEWEEVGNPSDRRLLSAADILIAETWAGSRPPKAPEITPLQLEFIKASEAEDIRRQSAEAQRLQEIAEAQIERGKALAERERALEGERDQRVLASLTQGYRVLYIDPLQAVDEMHAALSVKKTPEGDQALRTAMDVGLRRYETRQDEREVLGSGAGYLMGRWRRGNVFARLRSDGHYALVASERGKDGPDPPGSVYLINMDNLRTTELQAGDRAKGRRLEFMGFSLSGREIFVTRQFYLDIFDLEGSRTKSVQLEFHAKPTHLVAGMFGSYLLVGDTLGHLMVADTVSESRPQLRKGSRRGDPALFVESSMDANRAIIVFESGRVELVLMDNPTSPVECELETTSAIQATFCSRFQKDRFLVTTSTGLIDVWQLESGVPARLTSFKHGETSVGLASFSGDGNRVISLGEDRTYKIWDIASQNLMVSYEAAFQ